MTVFEFTPGFADFPKGSVSTNGFRLRVASIASLIVALAVCVSGQTSSISAYQDPQELVRKAVKNEIKAADEDTSHFMFRGVKTTSKESTTRLYVETTEAIAGMAVAYNGIPLSAEQRQAEEARVERLITHPDELKKKHDQEHDNAEHTKRIMRALPDAFLYEYAGEEKGSAERGRGGEPLVKLKFRPNPNYAPPSRVEEVLTGMEGYVMIDSVRYRIASIDGTLFKEVGFGWGILGHLDRGGRFVVHQVEVGENVWEISSMTLNITGKILVFKSLSINTAEVFGNFKQVPSNLTFTQGFEMLKKEQSNLTASNSCCPRESTASQ